MSKQVNPAPFTKNVDQIMAEKNPMVVNLAQVIKTEQMMDLPPTTPQPTMITVQVNPEPLQLIKPTMMGRFIGKPPPIICPSDVVGATIFKWWQFMQDKIAKIDIPKWYSIIKYTLIDWRVASSYFDSVPVEAKIIEDIIQSFKIWKPLHDLGVELIISCHKCIHSLPTGIRYVYGTTYLPVIQIVDASPDKRDLADQCYSLMRSYFMHNLQKIGCWRLICGMLLLQGEHYTTIRDANDMEIRNTSTLMNVDFGLDGMTIIIGIMDNVPQIHSNTIKIRLYRIIETYFGPSFIIERKLRISIFSMPSMSHNYMTIANLYNYLRDYVVTGNGPRCIVCGAHSKNAYMSGALRGHTVCEWCTNLCTI